MKSIATGNSVRLQLPLLHSLGLAKHAQVTKSLSSWHTGKSAGSCLPAVPLHPFFWQLPNLNENILHNALDAKSVWAWFPLGETARFSKVLKSHLPRPHTVPIVMSHFEFASHLATFLITLLLSVFRSARKLGGQQADLRSVWCQTQKEGGGVHVCTQLYQPRFLGQYSQHTDCLQAIYPNSQWPLKSQGLSTLRTVAWAQAYLVLLKFLAHANAEPLSIAISVQHCSVHGRSHTYSTGWPLFSKLWVTGEACIGTRALEVLLHEFFLTSALVFPTVVSRLWAHHAAALSHISRHASLNHRPVIRNPYVGSCCYQLLYVVTFLSVMQTVTPDDPGWDFIAHVSLRRAIKIIDQKFDRFLENGTPHIKIHHSYAIALFVVSVWLSFPATECQFYTSPGLLCHVESHTWCLLREHQCNDIINCSDEAASACSRASIPWTGTVIRP